VGITPILLIAPLLVLAAYCDLRFLRIPNPVSATLVLFYVVFAILFPPDDLMARMLAVAAVFSTGFLAFAFGLVGAGDVKLLSALLLFVPSDQLILFANIFSASLLIGVTCIVLLRHVQFQGLAGWKSMSEPKAFPMGLSIALAGLTFPAISAIS
jgi:prepilin peptidase CpaA